MGVISGGGGGSKQKHLGPSARRLQRIAPGTQALSLLGDPRRRSLRSFQTQTGESSGVCAAPFFVHLSIRTRRHFELARCLEEDAVLLERAVGVAGALQHQRTLKDSLQYMRTRRHICVCK